MKKLEETETLTQNSSKNLPKNQSMTKYNFSQKPTTIITSQIPRTV